MPQQWEQQLNCANELKTNIFTVCICSRECYVMCAWGNCVWLSLVWRIYHFTMTTSCVVSVCLMKLCPKSLPATHTPQCQYYNSLRCYFSLPLSFLLSPSLSSPLLLPPPSHVGVTHLELVERCVWSLWRASLQLQEASVYYSHRPIDCRPRWGRLLHTGNNYHSCAQWIVHWVHSCRQL